MWMGLGVKDAYERGHYRETLVSPHVENLGTIATLGNLAFNMKSKGREPRTLRRLVVLGRRNENTCSFTSDSL